MAYVCQGCDFFDAQSDHAPGCPQCGGRMRMTLVDPRATAVATLDEPEEPTWRNEHAFGYEEIEAPWAFRWAQIGAGFSTYFFVARWSRRITTFFFIMNSPNGVLSPQQQLKITVIVVLLNCIAALAGGAAAGFWARNWIVQGLGVIVAALAVQCLPLFFFPPDSWPVIYITLATTTLFARCGAFLGHVLVRPTRIAKS